MLSSKNINCKRGWTINCGSDDVNSNENEIDPVQELVINPPRISCTLNNNGKKRIVFISKHNSQMESEQEQQVVKEHCNKIPNTGNQMNSSGSSQCQLMDNTNDVGSHSSLIVSTNSASNESSCNAKCANNTAARNKFPSEEVRQKKWTVIGGENDPLQYLLSQTSRIKSTNCTTYYFTTSKVCKNSANGYAVLGDSGLLEFAEFMVHKTIRPQLVLVKHGNGEKAAGEGDSPSQLPSQNNCTLTGPGDGNVSEQSNVSRDSTTSQNTDTSYHQPNLNNNVHTECVHADLPTQNRSLNITNDCSVVTLKYSGSNDTRGPKLYGYFPVLFSAVKGGSSSTEYKGKQLPDRQQDCDPELCPASQKQANCRSESFENSINGCLQHQNETQNAVSKQKVQDSGVQDSRSASECSTSLNADSGDEINLCTDMDTAASTSVSQMEPSANSASSFGESTNATSSTVHLKDLNIPLRQGAPEDQKISSPVVTAEMRKIYNDVTFGNIAEDDIAYTYTDLRNSRIEVYFRDLARLAEREWLNDEVINSYLTLIARRSEASGLPSCYSFSTFFYPSLCSNRLNMNRWMKTYNPFDYDIILVPLHLTAHWALTVIDNRKKTIVYYDSLGRSGMKSVDRVYNFLQQISSMRKIECPKYVTSAAKGIPKQHNSFDCGMFTLCYAECISRDDAFNFQQHDMSRFRVKLLNELNNQELCL